MNGRQLAFVEHMADKVLKEKGAPLQGEVSKHYVLLRLQLPLVSPEARLFCVTSRGWLLMLARCCGVAVALPALS